jgi:hypothetical protein
MTEVLVHVAGYRDSDNEERAELASKLRAELLAVDTDDVTYGEKAAQPGERARRSNGPISSSPSPARCLRSSPL